MLCGYQINFITSLSNIDIILDKVSIEESRSNSLPLQLRWVSNFLSWLLGSKCDNTVDKHRR